jgi:WD40 repeat protein
MLQRRFQWVLTAVCVTVVPAGVSGQQEPRALKGHAASIEALRWSPDGKRLASASSDKTVKIWDADNGREIHTLKGHGSAVTGVAWSPDSKRLASSSPTPEGELKVWDAEKEEESFTLKGHRNVRSVAWSPDGMRLASASTDKSVKVWDAEKGQPAFTLKGHAGFVVSVSFSPDGKRLASAALDGSLKVWDAEKKEEWLSLKGVYQSKGVLVLTGVAWSHDSKRLASVGPASSSGWEAEIWNVSPKE